MSNNAENNNDNNKREELKRLVIDAISKECAKHDSSPLQQHDDLRAVANGLAKGRKLQLTILTGGLCNYSYKVHFKKNDESGDDDDHDDTVALFAKLTFGAPLLFPDAQCSPERTNREYEMMELYADVSPYPESTITPYFCIDVVDGSDGEGSNEEGQMKLLVTEFSSRLEEQAANVFVDGDMIDTNFAIKLAKGLSTLHNTEVTNPDFNKDMKPFFQGLTHVMAPIFDGYFDQEHQQIDGATKYARSIGKERLDKVLEVYRETLDRSDCYVHGDCHVFNMMVEGKQKSLSDLIKSFNDNNEDDNEEESTTTSSSAGDVALVDWEMSHCGPIGKDIGFFHPFPLACVFAHTLNGDLKSSKNILEFLDVLWNEYSSSIDLNNDRNLSLVDVYRQVLAFCGVITVAYSALGFHMEYLPIEEERVDDLTNVKESLGIVGLKFMNIGFESDPATEATTLQELRNQFNEIIREEMDRLTPPVAEKKKANHRLSSLLRETGRRVSDSHTYFGLATTAATTVKVEEVDGASTTRTTNSTCSKSSAAAVVATKRESILQVEKLMIDVDYGNFE